MSTSVGSCTTLRVLLEIERCWSSPTVKAAPVFSGLSYVERARRNFFQYTFYVPQRSVLPSHLYRLPHNTQRMVSHQILSMKFFKAFVFTVNRI